MIACVMPRLIRIAKYIIILIALVIIELVVFKTLLQEVNWNNDLSLPSIYDPLPHIIRSAESLNPSLKWSKGKLQARMVIGISTVKRQNESYLEQTMTSIFKAMSTEEEKDVLIVLMIAEPNDKEYIETTSRCLRKIFEKQIDQGLLDIIVPPAQFYPDISKLNLSFGDSIERVRWRSKQNLDYAFLMMYAKQRGSAYYVQLEDDILVKTNFVTTMNKAVEEYNAANKTWFMMDFCLLGFIGKLFRIKDLHILIQFFLIFFNDKPVDWLLKDIISTKSCSPEQDRKNCSATLHIKHKPSLFQHIGTHSSLKGKVQKAKDYNFLPNRFEVIPTTYKYVC